MREFNVEPETLTAIHRAEHDALWTPPKSIRDNGDLRHRKIQQRVRLQPRPYKEDHIIVDSHGAIIRRGANMPPAPLVDRSEEYCSAVAKRLIFAETGTANNSRSQTDDGVK